MWTSILLPATRSFRYRDSADESASRLARSAGVRREDCAGSRHLAVDELQMPKHAVVPEDALTAAQHDRVDHQLELVDQVVLNQRLDQLRAANYKQITAVLLLQRDHCLGDIALDHCRVLPLEWFYESR